MKAICKFCGKEGNLGSEIVLALTKEQGSQRVITYYLCANEGACKERILRKEVKPCEAPKKGMVTQFETTSQENS